LGWELRLLAVPKGHMASNTTVHRTYRDKSYTIVANDILDDRRLKPKDGWVLIQMLRMPEDWIFREADMAERCGMSPDLYRKTLRVLRRCGYVVKMRARNEMGHFGPVETHVFAHPDDAEVFADANGLSIGEGEPLMEKPRVENPPVEKHPPTNKESTKEREYKETYPLNPPRGEDQEEVPSADNSLFAEAADKDEQPSPKKRGSPQLPDIPDALNTPAFVKAWQEFLQHRKELRKPMTPTAAKRLFAKLEPIGPERAAAATLTSIAYGYQGIFPEKGIDASGGSGMDGGRWTTPRPFRCTKTGRRFETAQDLQAFEDWNAGERPDLWSLPPAIWDKYKDCT